MRQKTLGKCSGSNKIPCIVIYTFLKFLNKDKGNYREKSEHK